MRKGKVSFRDRVADWVGKLANPTLLIIMALLLLTMPQAASVSLAGPNENSNYPESVSNSVADSFRLPLDYWSVLQDFGVWNSTWGGYHLAEDAAASIGTSVYASGNGTVKYAGYAGGYSGLVIIEHTLSDQSKVCTLYGHLTTSTIQVSSGQQVSKGQLIGYIANPSDYGYSGSAHIHFGIRKGAYSTSQICGHWPYVGYSQSCTGITHAQYRDMWHDPSDFVTSHGELLDPPNLISPPNGASCAFTQPTFQWSSVSGANRYWLLVATTPSALPTDPYADSCPGCVLEAYTSSTSYTPSSPLQSGTTYYWEVQGFNNSTWPIQQGQYSETWSFATLSTPSAPSLSSPSNGSSTCDTTPTFSWGSVSGATSYRIQVDDSSSFSSPAINTTTSSSNYTPGSALSPGTYYWRVQASNSCGDGSWSSTWSFTILSTPSAPSLSSPSNGSSTCDTTPTFSWGSVSGATSYRIQVDDSSSFSSPAINTTTSSSNYTPGSALSPGTYYWRVQASNSCGDGSWSSTWSFTILSTPSAPSLSSPSNGSSTSDTTPDFDWSSVSEATSYRIQVDNNSNFSSPEIDTTVLSSNYTPGSALSPDIYYWRVQASNSCGTGPWSSVVWELTIETDCPQPPAPSLTSPSNSSNTNNDTPTFDWDAATDSDEYQIQVDNNSDFSSSEIDETTTSTDYTPASGLSDGTYYWHVRGHNTSGGCDVYGNWSSTWSIIVDTTPPTSTVDSLPATESSTSFGVSWSGSDAPSGIFCYDVQYRDGLGGTWTDWQSCTISNSATFTGEDGHTYYFQSRARDNAGNIEDYPGGDGDTHTTVDVTAPPPITIAIFPLTTTTWVSSTFTVDIKFDTGTETADTLDAYIDFDPTYLEVVDESGTPTDRIELNTDVFSSATFNSVDNAVGQINFSASRFDSPLEGGPFTAATIRFRAKAEADSTPLTFVRSGARWSDLLQSGETINPTITDCTVSITPSVMVLNGRVALERRGNEGDARWITELYRVSGETTGGIKVYEAGTTNLLGTFTATTDANGGFSAELTGIEPGTYDISVKGSNTLSNKKSSITLPTETEINFGTLLVGDSNGNDAVNGADVSYMIPSFLLCSDAPEFRPYGDTNNNGCINGADVSALIPNFLKAGPISVAVSAIHASGVTSQDVRLASGESLSLSPSSRSALVGAIFTMDIVADTGTSTADTVDAYIDFAPTYLEVVDESGTPVSAIELNTDVFSNATFNSVDNATGQINFSASKYDSPYLTGSFTVATIRFKAKAAIESTSLNFVQSGARWSDLYLFGESINPTLTNGTATVICPDFVDPPGVGVEDIMLVANCWRCKCEDTCYDSRYDIDDDCDIDIVDIMLVVKHWGETCN